MIKNFWENVKFVCTKHEHPLDMVLREGTTAPFYACENYDNKEDQCLNRISFHDAQDIVEKLAAYIAASDEYGGTDFTNFTFKYKKIDVKVVKYRETEIVLSVLDRRIYG